MPTERGDIVRVWEYDRVNHTVWSVDMLFEGDTLWAHPRITNPSPTQDLNGYWWTNVGQKITVAGTERVVMPAKYDYAGVPWCEPGLLSTSLSLSCHASQLVCRALRALYHRPTGNYFLPEGAVGQNNGVDGGGQNFTGLSFGAVCMQNSRPIFLRRNHAEFYRDKLGSATGVDPVLCVGRLGLLSHR